MNVVVISSQVIYVHVCMYVINQVFQWCISMHHFRPLVSFDNSFEHGLVEVIHWHVCKSLQHGLVVFISSCVGVSMYVLEDQCMCLRNRERL